jgi:serine/threonine-protein kinase RsbW
MTDGESRHGRRPLGPDSVELRVAARLENLAVLRTLVGAAGTHADLDFDAVADLRLAVDEACTRLIGSAAPGAQLVIVIDSGPEDVTVEASAECRTDEVVVPGSFSWLVLSSLTDDVQTFRDGYEPGGDGRVIGITLTARRAGASR